MNDSYLYISLPFNFLAIEVCIYSLLHYRVAEEEEPIPWSQLTWMGEPKQYSTYRL